jgi:uncharacterized protein (TIGR03435 family)
MHDATDMDLLRQYAAGNSDLAFAELVARHVNLVYSAALRKTGNPHAAEEITQAVFIILAQKAGRISDKTILPGWLYQTARLTAASFLKSEVRRARREQEAYMQTEIHAVAPDETWEQIAPLLEDAMGQLGEKDRAAVVLRFFGGKSFAEVGAAAGVSENAAKKRVNHALEKLNRYFIRRGVSSTTAILAGAISANSVQAAPAALVKTMSTVAIAKGVTASVSTLTLIKGALKIMAWTKAKVIVVVGVAVILTTGTATVAIKIIQKHNAELRPVESNFQWQVADYSTELLNQAPPLVEIVPTKFPNGGSSVSYWDDHRTNSMGIGEEMIFIVEAAYGGVRSSRTVLSTTLPPGRFDFISSLPSGAMEALQQKIKNEYGVVARRETFQTNALLLIVKNPTADGLKTSIGATSSYQGNGSGHLVCTNQPISLLADMLEGQFRIPIIDRTGLTNHYDFNFSWDEYGKKVGNQYPNYPNLEGLKQVLLDQLGLELVPSREPIEMLVVEKVK